MCRGFGPMGLVLHFLRLTLFDTFVFVTAVFVISVISNLFGSDLGKSYTCLNVLM